MDKVDDGGEAFPKHQGEWTGMSLRDYFAARAMQGMCAGSWPRADEVDSFSKASIHDG